MKQYCITQRDVRVTFLTVQAESVGAAMDQIDREVEGSFVADLGCIEYSLPLLPFDQWPIEAEIHP